MVGRGQGQRPPAPSLFPPSPHQPNPTTLLPNPIPHTPQNPHIETLPPKLHNPETRTLQHLPPPTPLKTTTENSVVVAEGELGNDGVFHVRALGLPPTEAREELPMAAQVCMGGGCVWGGKLPMAAQVWGKGGMGKGGKGWGSVCCGGERDLGFGVQGLLSKRPASHTSASILHPTVLWHTQCTLPSLPPRPLHTHTPLAPPRTKHTCMPTHAHTCTHITHNHTHHCHLISLFLLSPAAPQFLRGAPPGIGGGCGHGGGGGAGGAARRGPHREWGGGAGGWGGGEMGLRRGGWDGMGEGGDTPLDGPLAACVCVPLRLHRHPWWWWCLGEVCVCVL